jgi:hypothetical protein
MKGTAMRPRGARRTAAASTGLARYAGARFGLRLLLPGLLLCASPQAARAQVSYSLTEGTRVRIRRVESRATWVGTIASLARDTIVLRLQRRGELNVAFPLYQVDRIELSQGRRPFLLQGAFFGALVAGLGAMSYNHLDTFSCTGVCDDDPDLNTAAFAALGAVAGGVLGGLIRKERWLRVCLPGGHAPR